MSKKRGLSLDEKRQKMLEIFHERKSFFQLKEIEKIAPKEKGITPMSVKEVLQSLVDDNLVDQERIGTSNYFWSYPSKVINTKKRKLDALQQQIDNYKKKICENDRKLSEVKDGKEPSEKRDDLLATHVTLKDKDAELTKVYENYRECDPDVINQMKEQGRTALEAANRWTDNVFSVKSWCTKKFGMDGKMIDKQFGIPEDFDYVEE